MDGISGVVSRVAEIQALIGSLQPAAVGRPAPSTTSSGSGVGSGTGVGGGSGSGSGTSAGTSGPAFASVLSDSIAARPSTSGLLSGAGAGAAGATARTGAVGAAVATATAGVTAGVTAGATSAVAAGVAAAAGAAGGVRSTAGLRTAAGVPLELVAHGNGRVPAGALSSIGQGSHTMWAPAAQAYRELRAAAARDGVTLKVTDSYRSYEQQVDLARRKGLYSQGGLAAKPGTSEHGWGLSLDLSLDSKALTWMRTHAKQYGFSENVPRESWHWTFTA
ncbi:M15 family metallopeptidase [Kineococcus sp. SYSU DK005]|uniref:M15 family metallopeptidase n=1 Tax=Kineococcus sp. SYSU DK005 TaxID=3383126 RepID=UPI003D7C7711